VILQARHPGLFLAPHACAFGWLAN
jgi:hypothetical protein